MQRIVAAAAALGMIGGIAWALRVPSQAAPVPVESPRYDVPLSDELVEHIIIECETAEPPVPVPVVLAIIEHESGFQADAIGHNDNGTTDHGLMQINSVNHEWLEIELGLSDMHDPRQNVTAGVHILSGLIEDEGSLDAALMAYQCGPTRARELREQGVTQTEFCRWVMEKVEEQTCERSHKRNLTQSNGTKTA